MTFDEANEIYHCPRLGKEKVFLEAIEAFGIKLNDPICLRCEHYYYGECFVAIGRIREIAHCNFFTEVSK